MSSTECELFNGFTVAYSLVALSSLLFPSMAAVELQSLRLLALVLTIGHIHYAVSVVQQLCEHFRINATDTNENPQKNNFKPLPTPPIMPVIGHIHLLRDYQHNPWDGLDEIRKKYGNVVSLKMGVHPMVLVSSCDAMKEILLKKGDIFSNRPNFPRYHVIFGGDRENSLALCSWSNTHRDRRKFCKKGIVPCRYSSRNQLLETIISRLVLKFIHDLEQQEPDKCSMKTGLFQDSAEDNIFNIGDKFHFNATKNDILFLTSDIFMEFLCSGSYSRSDSEYKEFVRGCDFVFWDINQSYLIDFLPYLTSLGLGFGYLKQLKKVTDFLRRFIDGKIFEPRRLKHINNLANMPSDNTNELEEGKHDYLDSIIIEHLSKSTSMSLADYRVGFEDLLAGHAAVANILMRLLGHLALNRDIQDMICDEAKQANVHNLDYKPSLPIAEASIQEALRLASSPIVPHVAREDTSIDQFFVPEGTMVLFNLYHLNLSEYYWKNPLEYDPMRFIVVGENEDGTKTYKLDVPKHFMPFSVGKRQCLGYKMVETTSIVVVANICRKFIIKADDADLVKRLLAPKGSVALNPDAECFELKLYPR